jgi:hypothetical protein
MPRALLWTDAQDTTLRRLRAEGETWEAIAAALGVARFTAIERGRRIGAPRPAPGPRIIREDPNREPLPAGHPRAWGALVAGTVLDGETYPLPVFSR